MASEDIVKYQFTSEQSRTEAAENGRLGGIASGIARRRKKTMREAAEFFLSLPATAKDKKVLKRIGVGDDDADMQMAVIAGISTRAIKGDARAARLLFEILGENKTENTIDTEDTDSYFAEAGLE